MTRKLPQRWVVSKGISIRKAANELGFDIEHLKKFERKQQLKFRHQLVRAVLQGLDEDWEDAAEGFPSSVSRWLPDVKKGVYLLCLDDGLCVNYSRGLSRVLYIGKGAIRLRISNHLHQKLLDFFLTLPGIKFRFDMTEAKRKKLAKYFEHLETDLLTAFEKKYGELPLFNKNFGHNHRSKHVHRIGWNKPLKNVKAMYKWALSSTESRKKSPKLDS